MQQIEPDCGIKLSVRNDSPEERFNANLKQAIYTKASLYTKDQGQIESGSNCVHAVA